MKPAVLIIDNSMYETGAFKAIVNESNHLSEKYFFHFFISKGSKNISVLKKCGFPVTEIGFLEISKSLRTVLYLPVLIRNAIIIRKYLKRNKISVLHVNDIYNLTGCVVKMLIPSIKLVYHVRLLKNSYIKLFYRFFCKMVKWKADSIICVSYAVLKDIGGTPKAKVVYDGIVYSELLPAWNRLREPASASFLYLANIVRGKGQEFALSAFAKLSNEYPDLKMSFVGAVTDMTFYDSLKSIVLKYKLEEKVWFKPQSDNVENTYKSHDISLMFSESESFSMVSLESLYYGIPLIASDCGGPAEITNNGAYCLLVENRNIENMYLAMKHAITNAAELKEKATGGKAYVRSVFNPAAGTLLQTDIYKPLL